MVPRFLNDMFWINYLSTKNIELRKWSFVSAKIKSDLIKNTNLSNKMENLAGGSIALDLQDSPRDATWWREIKLHKLEQCILFFFTIWP